MQPGRSEANTFSKFLCLVAILSLMHCAYSAAQHRSYLRLTEQEFTGLPSDLLIQTLISLIALCYSATQIAGSFVPIEASTELENKLYETVSSCPSFITFEHRAKALSPYFALSNYDARL